MPANDAYPDICVTTQRLATFDIQREAASSMHSAVHFDEAYLSVSFWGHQPAGLQRAEHDAMTAISSTISPKLPTILGVQPQYTSSPAEALTLITRPAVATELICVSFDSITVATATSKPSISYTSQRAGLPVPLLFDDITFPQVTVCMVISISQTYAGKPSSFLCMMPFHILPGVLHKGNSINYAKVTVLGHPGLPLTAARLAPYLHSGDNAPWLYVPHTLAAIQLSGESKLCMCAFWVHLLALLCAQVNLVVIHLNCQTLEL